MGGAESRVTEVAVIRSAVRAPATPPRVRAETLKLLQRLLKSPGCRKIPVLVQNKDDVVVTASNFSSER